MSFNPKFKDFVEKHPNKSMLGMWWSLNWRPWLIILAIQIALTIILVATGAAALKRSNIDWSQGPAGALMQGKLNINLVCESALAYMTFPDGASADAFLEKCKEGMHPEVIEKYKSDMNLGDGATI